MGKPHGLGGEVYVVPISDDPHRFDVGASLLDEQGEELLIESARRHNDRLLIKFAGVDDRDTAATMKGPLYVTEDALRALDDDEFWTHDAIGCEVFTVDDPTPVGTVRDLMSGAAQDLLVLDTPRGERLVPLVKAIVVEVDVAARRVVLDPPAGLLD